ncbi:MAG: hypothetical protein GY800_13240, partial [Planctomycetes bacterium]|nr:hypothetical protein [Planctomycetota bacterium]
MQKIQDLLDQNMIVEIDPTTAPKGFYSRFFLVPKKGLDELGRPRWRAVLDLSAFNKYIVIPKFRMETPEAIRAMLDLGDFATSIDVEDAYHHVKIHRRYRKYLRFMFQGRTFEFAVMVAGIAVAPWAFSRLLAAMRQYCHNRGIAIHQYLDDWLIRHLHPDILQEHTDFLVELSEHLGWVIHRTKSDLVPRQVFQFLGYIFDTVNMVVSPPANRWDKLQPLLDLFLSTDSQKAHTWQKLLGCLSALEKLVPLGMIRLRPLQYHFHSQWTASVDSPSVLVPVTDRVKTILHWWNTKSNLTVGVPMRLDTPSKVVFTDASKLGWGAHCDELSAQGEWDLQEAQLTINELELKAVHLALKQFLPALAGKSVLISTDNQSAVAYINKKGGTRSYPLCRLAEHLWYWAMQNNIQLKARHIPGVTNILADALSRSTQVLPLE